MANSYTAEQIEVLEGLEPVRRRPGMYIGGTDEKALHHLVGEGLDNAMDEAVAGHAKTIYLAVLEDSFVEITDDGRGIPVDPHPKFPDKSALEVILTQLHSGGKFSSGAYSMSGGLHGVGLSVIAALSARLDVEVCRDNKLYAITCQQGAVTAPLEVRPAPEALLKKRRSGTRLRFQPDPDIFGQLAFSPERIYQMALEKACLQAGVKIIWHFPGGAARDAATSAGFPPVSDVLHYPNGLQDYLASQTKVGPVEKPFCGRIQNPDFRLEWALVWQSPCQGVRYWCNTIPTPLGGTHEQGLRLGIGRAVRAHGERVHFRKVKDLTQDDIMEGLFGFVSVFIPEPQFQGQTKEKLASREVTRLVEGSIRDALDHYLAADLQNAQGLLEAALGRAELRKKRTAEKETLRKSTFQRLRLPGKLADCSSTHIETTELFLVEGDSAGGSAKQARDRLTQAVLPLRGKILNVASASADKLTHNQELKDLQLALGCGRGANCRLENLRYGKIIIMTDADVDGAHIASLLMTFFFREMRPLVQAGRLYLAQPPLFRISYKDTIRYARDEEDKAHLLETVFAKKTNVEISRFKGLGEMLPRQLRDTAMRHDLRTLARVSLPPLPDDQSVEILVATLMGRQADKRFRWIQENAQTIRELDI